MNPDPTFCSVPMCLYNMSCGQGRKGIRVLCGVLYLVSAKILYPLFALMENQVFEEVKVNNKERIHWKTKSFMYVLFSAVKFKTVKQEDIYILPWCTKGSNPTLGTFLHTAVC